MTSSTYLIRLARVLVLAAVVAGTAASVAEALVGRPPDVRDAAAANVAVPDVFERYAAAHPYGQKRGSVEASGLPRSATAIQAGASDGFDWSDYGVGIGTGIGLGLLFAGGLVGARQRRHRVQAA